MSAPATATATLITVAPSGYGFTTDEAVFNTVTAKNAGFTLNGLTSSDVGDEYVYSLAAANLETKGGTGTITSTLQHVGSIDISSFPDGEVDFLLLLKDPAGNAGQEVTAAAQLDTGRAHRLYDCGGPAGDWPGGRRGLHLHGRHGRRYLQYLDYQQRRRRGGDRQRVGHLGHPGHHAHPRLRAAQRDADL